MNEPDRVWSFGAGSQNAEPPRRDFIPVGEHVKKRQLADNTITCWIFLQDKRDSLPVAVYEIYRRIVRRVCLQNPDCIVIDKNDWELKRT